MTSPQSSRAMSSGSLPAVRMVGACFVSAATTADARSPGCSRLPGVTADLRARLRLHPRPAARARISATSDRCEIGARSIDRRPETGDPGWFQRPLFASLRDHRADTGNALRQRWRRCRHRPRLPVRPLAAAAAPRRCGLSADGGGAIFRSRRQPCSGRTPAIMFRHDWRTLAALPPQRWLAALFSFDLRAALMGPIEVGPGRIAHFHDPRPGHDRRD